MPGFIWFIAFSILFSPFLSTVREILILELPILELPKTIPSLLVGAGDWC
jgi:hypothetical protein